MREPGRSLVGRDVRACAPPRWFPTKGDSGGGCATRRGCGGRRVDGVGGKEDHPARRLVGVDVGPGVRATTAPGATTNAFPAASATSRPSTRRTCSPRSREKSARKSWACVPRRRVRSTAPPSVRRGSRGVRRTGKSTSGTARASEPEDDAIVAALRLLMPVAGMGSLVVTPRIVPRTGGHRDDHRRLTHYLPATSRHMPLAFYDTFTRLLGVRDAHWRLVAQAGIEPGATVLEIGTGTGPCSCSPERRPRCHGDRARPGPARTRHRRPEGAAGRRDAPDSTAGTPIGSPTPTGAWTGCCPRSCSPAPPARRPAA